MEKVNLKCFGCKVNQYEGYKLKAYLEKRINREIYLIQGCAVTKRAEEKARKYIKKLKGKEVYVSGCLSKIPYFYENYKVLKPVDTESSYWDKKRFFLKIQDGCSNFCSYCIIPYLRNKIYSISPDKILRELENYRDLEEVVLCGTNLITYNYNGIDLIELIKKIKENFSFRIRLSSLEPDFLTKEILYKLLELKNVAKHFHIPLQSGSDRVLKHMRRNYTVSEFFELIKIIRNKWHLSGITTDLIVGFPAEDEEDFNETKKFIKLIKFSKIHIFTYSKREGTLASLYKELPEEEKKRRKEEIDLIERELAFDFARKNIGEELDVVPVRRNKDFVEGLSENYLRVFYRDSDFKRRKLKIEKSRGRDLYGA